MQSLETEELLMQLLAGARIEIVWSIIVVGVIFYFLIFFKDFINNVLFYFQFKSNSYVSIGTLVEVNEFVGRIKDFGLKYIIVEGEKGYYRLAMNTWQRQDWIFLRTEWKEQNKIAGQRLGLRRGDDIKIDRKSPEYRAIMEAKEKAHETKSDSN